MPKEQAELNMQALSENPYPGRGIIMGRSDQGEMVQVYWVMGRSPNSRNRILVEEDGVVRTEALDPSKVEDPALIIYNAMASRGDYHVVSNGNQTDAVVDFLRHSEDFAIALSGTSHEPDAPNYTPRITGLVHSLRRTMEFSKIIRRPDASQEGLFSARFYYGYQRAWPGYGYCLHTYSGDGNPLPTFDRDPYLVSLKGDIGSIAASYWELLNPDNRVALAVKSIGFMPTQPQIKIINAASR